MNFIILYIITKKNKIKFLIKINVNRYKDNF